MIMRDTVFTLSSRRRPRTTIAPSIHAMVDEVRNYVPGYRLKQEVQFEQFGANHPVNIPGCGEFTGLKTTVFLEVEGAAHYLPAYAGNLDIMTSAALQDGRADRRSSEASKVSRRCQSTNRPLYIQDVTLRDGMHAIRHQYHLDHVRAIARALDEAGVDAIEVAHGDGLPGSSSTTASARTPTGTGSRPSARDVKHARADHAAAARHRHDRGPAARLRLGVRSVRVATHCTEADIAKQHIRGPRARHGRRPAS